MKTFFKKLRKTVSAGMTKINTKIGALLTRPLLFCFCWSVILVFILEILGRRSFFDAVIYFVGSPLMFFYNALIIMLTFAITLLFKRRYFAMFLVTVFWLGSGIANCVLLSFRTTPFSAIDLTLVPYAISIIDIYLSKNQIILVTSLIILAILTLIYIAFRAPKHREKIPYFRLFCAIGIIGALIFTISFVGTQTKVLGTRFGNLADAYENFGFAYCLSNSFVDTGIKKPANYSKESVDKVVAPLLQEEKSDDEKETPNIIFIQLESFFDVNYLKNVTFSANPIPVFTQLKKEYPSGFLNVPSVGAGTANTEFEVLTGMNLDFFGAGEYPYKTVLLRETTESLANNLKELGYYTYAMHNNRASFYGRDEVFSQMGFDCFDSKEYMQDIEYTQAGWAEDKVLIGEIEKALTATEQQDFIYSITVQGHGKYTAKGLDYTEPVTLTMAEDEDVDAYACFTKQLHEVDTFIGELLSTLEALDEETMVVFFGDHLPSLEVSASDLENGNLYQTEYVIWNNLNINAPDKDLYTYQLGAYALNLLNIDNGIVTKYHQQNSDKFSYLQNLGTLQYDMLYGEKYCYDKKQKYQPTELKMGINDIFITDVLYYKGTSSVYVFGEGFNDASKIYVNYEQVPTRFLNNNTLMISQEYDLENGDEFVVKQAGKNRIPLSSTVAYFYTMKEEDYPKERTIEETFNILNSIDD